MYNSSFERIRKTLVSFLEQEDVRFEIIVTDDGSEENHREEIESLFAEYGFKDYKMVMNPINRGTVKNHNAGLAVAEGKYNKGLSPGDYFHDKHVIRDWIDFLEASGAEWAISDAIYYDKDTGIPVSVRAHPQDITPYLLTTVKKCIDKTDTVKIEQLKRQARWNYVVLDDIALGTVMLSTTELSKRYSARVEVKGIKYAEDNMWRVMMFDGVVASYYRERPTIYYEYGSGISTSGSTFWSKRLREDWLKANEIMRETEILDDFQKEMLKKIGNRILEKLIFRVKAKFMPRMTPLK